VRKGGLIRGPAGGVGKRFSSKCPAKKGSQVPKKKKGEAPDAVAASSRKCKMENKRDGY